MTDILQRLARLPEGRRAQFLAQLRAEVGGTAARGPVARQRTGPVPLSHNQEPLWSYARLAPDEPTYSMPFCNRITGPLDVDALRVALAGVIARHETLRTSVAEREDGPVQVIAAHVPVELPVIEVDGEDAEQRLATACALVGAEVRIAFKLDAGPLWRARLYRIDDDDHVLLFNVHHIVFDGWSQGVFAADLAELYAAARHGSAPALAELPLQYADFAAWQREWLSEGKREELTTYWRDKLGDAPVLAFPTDHSRPGQLEFAGTVAEFDLPDAAIAAAESLARKAGVTPFVVYAAAFVALLHRYTGQDDLVIGSPNANRRHSSVEPVIGFFINQLVLRTDLSGDPTFREVVDRVRAVVQDAFAHGDLPFGELVDAVRPPRDPSRQPLFQVAFALQNAGASMRLDGTTVADIEVATGTSRFDMAWNVTRQGEHGRLVVEYRTKLFAASTIERFAGHYSALLAGVGVNPDARVSTVDFITQQERAGLIGLGDGPVREVRPTTVVEVFQEQVRRTPGHTALVVAGDELSYAELNVRANQLAAHLTEQGARPGAVVGLAMPRSAELVIAVLAVLKTGAAYLPLDPGHPPARIGAILADADAVAVITHSSVEAVLADSPAPSIELDRLDLGTRPVADPPRAAAPNDIAYIIYTSGSTGKPKGVLIEHRSVVSFVDSVRELFELNQDDRMLGFASPNFDVSVFEMFAALLTGARLYYATDEERLSVDRLQALMEQAGITVIDLPPTVMALLEPERMPALRIVFVGGEAFSAELVNRWNPGRRLFNGYGPTEGTVTMIVQECAGRWETSPPIGVPMANHVAHVLDRNLAPVPIGVPGELVIGGAGLSRGYLNRPELTREKFVADPFGTAPDGRLYRTGDLVKRQPDGTLVFIDRIDQQVKIRGLRIELGEVEAAVASYPGIGQSAVVAWTDESGDKHLVGYLTPGGSGPDPGAVREHLAGRLPSYMIPSYFVVLPRLPLNSSGKVDRRALPAPDPGAAAGPVEQPRSETEQVLVSEIIGPLLKIEQVGVRDDFFSLGGNSLQAAQLMSRINRRFGVRVSLADFFVSPTPAHLAEIVDAQLVNQMSDDELFAMLESMPEDEVRSRLHKETR